MSRSLYICYFGVREPLVQTQVIPYLRELVKGGHEMSLVTFEPEAFEGSGEPGSEEETIKRELTEQGIHWHWLKYHKRFSAIATAWDIFQGARFVRKFIARERPDILHGRVHVPTLMGALARKLSGHKPKLLFDIRGFFPEEYVDAGVWPENGILYRTAKRIERWLMKESDGFVVLTEKAREILFPESKGTGFDKLGRPVEVIPCCVDLESRFAADGGEVRSETRRELGIKDRFVITHVGALGGLYLHNELADFLAAARVVEPKLFAIFLTQSDPTLIVPLLKDRGFSEDDFFVGRVPSHDVPRFLEASDLGISFVKSTFATLSRSPTKIPEYLAAGLPLIGNAGVGDVDYLVESYGVGALTGDFSSNSYIETIKKGTAMDGIGLRCREAARAEFDLQTVGGERYRRIYGRLSNQN